MSYDPCKHGNDPYWNGGCKECNKERDDKLAELQYKPHRTQRGELQVTHGPNRKARRRAAAILKAGKRL